MLYQIFAYDIETRFLSLNHDVNGPLKAKVLSHIFKNPTKKNAKKKHIGFVIFEWVSI